ncbi:hypothetical protein, partial [Streptomyces sp. HG99]|uniref:hypothetical protein n=2 Tax=Streptomyces TaxID=1883 RepID=UPI001C556992
MGRHNPRCGLRVRGRISPGSAWTSSGTPCARWKADAEAAAWTAAEPRLAGSAATAAHRAAAPAREAPLKPGPIQRHAGQALAVAAASFAGSL